MGPGPPRPEKYDFVHWDDDYVSIYGKMPKMATKPPSTHISDSCGPSASCLASASTLESVRRVAPCLKTQGFTASFDTKKDAPVGGDPRKVGI